MYFNTLHVTKLHVIVNVQLCLNMHTLKVHLHNNNRLQSSRDYLNIQINSKNDNNAITLKSNFVEVDVFVFLSQLIQCMYISDQSINIRHSFSKCQ